MCGIAGILDTGRGIGADRLRDVVIAMRDTMTHRGPDDQGVWIDPTGTCALAHRRLSIIDLSPLGHQPMVDDRGPFALSFNGEIYNFQELRRDLESQGASFQSHSDTEVLLSLVADQRPVVLNALRGMYALAAWNGPRRRLMLARDPFGKKPLYYAAGKGFVAFASELRALELLADLDLRICPEALGEYLLLQYVQAPRSIYRGVHKLPPGHYAMISTDGAIDTGSFWQFEAGSHSPDLELAGSYEERVDQLGERIEAAVQRRLVSDVPVGAFLSGGVDSALVVAVMKQLGVLDLRTYSVGFEDSPDSEHVQARDIAAHLDTEHHEILVRPDAIELAPKIADALDEPNGDSSCLPTWLLSEFTRRHVTVAISGDGGDEMFGGYGRYLDTAREHADPDQRWDGWTPSDAYLGPRWTIFQAEQIGAFLGKVPASVRMLLDGWRHRLDAEDRPLIHRMRSVDVESYLPGAVLAKVDRMSMQYSLEVRCPLLDVEVAEFAAAIGADDCIDADGGGKRILKSLLERSLPKEWVHRKKVGFGLPAGFWNPEALRDFARDVLDARSSRLRDHFDRRALRRWVKSQEDPNIFSIYRLWPMLALELWLAKPRPAKVRL